MTFMGKAGSNHWVPMDADESVGGDGAAAKPLELLLFGLGGCTGMDVVSILKKMSSEPAKLEISIEAERAEEHPKVFTKINIEYTFYGKNLKKENLEKAIKLSQEKYCSASAMFQKSAEITYSYKIIE